MTQLPTLGGLLDKANARYRIFDLGRRVVRIAHGRFGQIERGELPYPLPLQQQAWLGILFWDRVVPEQYFVWFLRFPLDELGRLQPAVRDEFLESVLRALGGPRASATGIQELQRESPFAFKPREERLAAFHAKALVELGRPPSRFYAHARDYLAGTPGYDQWAFVGVQGLADVAARLGEEDNAARVAGAIAHLPAEPLGQLCRLLENESLPGRISAALQRRLMDALVSGATPAAVIAALVRAVGNTARGAARAEMIGALLNSARRTEVDPLVAVAGRAWEALADETLRLRYLEALASAQGRELFPALMRDLLFVPEMRPLLLASFRSPARSPELAAAIGALLQEAAGRTA